MCDTPPPAPPVGKKSEIFHPADFRDIDKRARRAPDELALSFTDLIGYLTKGLTSDLAKLRSIFIWIGSQELLDPTEYPRDVPDTPYGLLKKFAQDYKKSAMIKLFRSLCRAAGLPSEFVCGFSKRYADYIGGDAIEYPNYNWIAVFVDGSWRIVDIRVAFIGVIGVKEAKASDWQLVEDTGQAVREGASGERKTVGSPTLVQFINENCFLPDPERFIYFCFPEDPAWQLLPEPWSKDKFIKTPVVTRYYLTTTWHLDDRHEAVVEAPDGRCYISLDQVPEEGHTIRYKLYYNEKRSKKKFPDKLQPDNYIKPVGGKGQQTLLTRLPQTGFYKLDVMDGSGTDLFKLLIKSTGKTEAVKPFPPIPGTGLGINQAAIDAGLEYLSREDGLVVAQEGEKVRFRFRMKKPLDVVTRLAHSVMPSQRLDSRVTHEEEDGIVTVNVSVPWHAFNPEFTLQVDVKPKDSEDDHLVNVLNYLLTPDRQMVNSIKGREKQLHEELEAATTDDDLHRLESAIREFRTAHMQDNDLYKKACTRLYDLHQDAVESAKGDENKLDTALKDVEQSHVVYLLHRASWFQQARELYRRMRRLSSMKHQVQSLSGKQISEIQTYNHPNAGIRAAVMATYILLGEKEKNLKKWSYVQTLLRRHGSQGILYRIQNHDVSTVNNKQLNSASFYLNQSTAEELRCMSVSAAALYNWSQAVVEKQSKVTDDQQEQDDQQEEEISPRVHQRPKDDNEVDDLDTDEREDKE